MIVKIILEDGITLSKYKKHKILDDYRIKGLVELPAGIFVRTIQGLPEGAGEFTAIIIIGKLQ